MDRRAAPRSLRELEVRAQALAGRTIGELAAGLAVALPASLVRAKGFVGQLVEAALGADPDAADAPDFPELGVELKTVPVGASGRPAESTFVCSIAMAGLDREEWESSRLRKRLRHVLWVPVDSARRAGLAERRFHGPRLWSPSPREEALLRADWEDLVGALASGDATLSAHRGLVLQVRPKARHAGIRRLACTAAGPQRVLPLGFYLRTAFTRTILAPAEPVVGRAEEGP